MKIIFWNIWGHRHPEGIHSFIRAAKADVCCFTEVTSAPLHSKPDPVYLSKDKLEPPANVNGFERLASEFQSDYRIDFVSPPSTDWVCLNTARKYNNVHFGSVMMISRAIQPLITGSESFVFGNLERMFQYTIVRNSVGEPTLVAHLHGIWLPHNTKGDDPLRDEQSRKILENLSRIATRHHVSRIVFGGDLNLAIDTRALRILEQGEPGLTNLVREFNVENTRTPAYRKFGQQGESRHADYVFVSPDVRLDAFTVLPEVLASDHAPLVLELN
jgi:endonuclease/exonuclease/phosphatase family metal-dependent hydrolase